MKNFDPANYKAGRQSGESVSEWLERVRQLSEYAREVQEQRFAAEEAALREEERARLAHEQAVREINAHAAREEAEYDRHHKHHRTGEYEPKTNLGSYLKYFWDQMTG